MRRKVIDFLRDAENLLLVAERLPVEGAQADAVHDTKIAIWNAIDAAERLPE